MSDPYFWARRVADDDWRPLTDFGASTTEDTGSSPLSVSGITPGQYKITVSDGQNAIKTNEIAKAKRDAVGRDFSPVVNAKIAFSQSNPSVKVGGTDYAASEIEEGDLEADVGGGGGTVQTLYDQANSNDLTAPSQSEEPTIVSSGTLVTDSNGDPAISVSDSQQLTRNRSSGPVTIGGIINPADDDEDFAYVNGLSLSSDGTNLRAHVNEAVVSSNSQSAKTDSSNYYYGTFNLGGTLYLFIRPDGKRTEIYEWTGSGWSEVLGKFEGDNTAGGTDKFAIAYNGKIYVGSNNDLYAWGPSDGSNGFQQVGFISSGLEFRIKYVYNGTLYLHDNGSDPGVSTYDGSNLSRSDQGTSEVFAQDAIVYDGRAYLLTGNSGTVDVKSWIPGDTTSWNREITLDDPNEFYIYNGDLYLATDTSLEKYDGSSWSTVTVPFGGQVDSGIEADGVMWVIAETTSGQDDWKLYVYDGQDWRSFSDPVDPTGIQSGGTFELIYNSEVFYFLDSSNGHTAQASYTQRNRSTTVSVPLPSGAFPAVAGTDGSTVALRAGGQESTATYSFSRNDKAGVEVGNTGGTIRHYVEFDTLLSQSNRSSLESALGSI